jgi:DNA polymerase III sliding clamp (beta) subunit (PCNA family)
MADTWVREQLYSVLAPLAKAIPSDPPVAAFGSIFFDGTRATIYDGEVSASSLCTLILDGGVDGKLLVAWLKGCSGTTVKLKTSDGTVTFQCGRSRLKTGLVDSTMLLFMQPKDQGIRIENPADLVDRMGMVKPFMGNDVAHVWRSGLTLAIEAKSAFLYATDNITMIEATAQIGADCEIVEVAIPPRSISIVVDFLKTKEIKSLEIAKEWVQAYFLDESTVYMRMGLDVAVEKYRELLKQTQEPVDEYIEISEELRASVAQIASMLSFTDEQECQLDSKDGVLTVRTSKNSKAFAESSAPASSNRHKDCLVWVAAKEFARMLSIGEKIAITETAVVVTGPGLLVLLATAVED